MSLRGAVARIELTVVDDAGSPVSNASVSSLFSHVGTKDPVAGMTDASGRCVLEHLTCGNSIEIVVEKSGFYKSSKRLCLIKMGHEHEIVTGKWMPSPLKEDVCLKRVLNPVVAVTHGGLYGIPATNEWCAFDFVANDWVAPRGAGLVSDVEFMYFWSGATPMSWDRQDFWVRFPGGTLNGGCLSPACPQSAFPFLYAANSKGEYKNELHDMTIRSVRRFGMLDGTKDFVFRFRSVTNDEGQIVTCNYGRFRRLDYGLERTGLGSLLMRYDYNAKTNDTNLEFANPTRHTTKQREK